MSKTSLLADRRPEAPEKRIAGLAPAMSRRVIGLSGGAATKIFNKRIAKEDLMKRVLAFIYGVIAYLGFFGTILYAIGFVENILVPKSIDSGTAGPLPEAIVINVALMALFAIQHSAMARKGFKKWWTQYVPAAIERSTYVLLANLSLFLLFWQWRPIPAVVWNIDDFAVASSLTAFSFFGWIIAFTSTFLINHFELFGLHQVANNLVGREMPQMSFRTPFYYKFVRHPIYLGFMIAFWATPTMTVGHLLFAAVTTAYIFVGIVLEERDLMDTFGEDYRRYRQRVSMLIPWRKSGAAQSGSQPPAKAPAN
jgi:protein-S-isoprenylcysteine O-methyltransferase Ste14